MQNNNINNNKCKKSKNVKLALCKVYANVECSADSLHNKLNARKTKLNKTN